VVATWTTNGSPHQIDRLEAGDCYTLIEVHAPEGYLLSQELTFSVEATGALQKVIMLDAPEPVPVPAAKPKPKPKTKAAPKPRPVLSRILPPAGDWSGLYGLVLAGSILMVLVCLIGIAVQHRRN
jgi:hypothetical protein